MLKKQLYHVAVYKLIYHDEITMVTLKSKYDSVSS